MKCSKPNGAKRLKPPIVFGGRRIREVLKAFCHLSEERHPTTKLCHLSDFVQPHATVQPRRNQQQGEQQLGSTPSMVGTPQKLHRPDHFCSRPTSIFRPSMSPEGMVQRHLVDRELLKVRALFSVGMPTLFLGAAPKDACAVCFWHVVVYRSNDSMSTRSWWLWSS
jgi:hypothetical protein